jgi:hypothetical protein
MKNTLRRIGEIMGTFRDFESAVAHRKAHVAMVQSMNGSPPLDPDKDSDGDVVIAQ